MKNQPSETITKWDGVTRVSREVTIDDYRYIDENNEELYRVVTYGNSGAKYRLEKGYIIDGREENVRGFDGATGHGWGGRVIGYISKVDFPTIDKSKFAKSEHRFLNQ